MSGHYVFGMLTQVWASALATTGLPAAVAGKRVTQDSHDDAGWSLNDPIHVSYATNIKII